MHFDMDNTQTLQLTGQLETSNNHPFQSTEIKDTTTSGLNERFQHIGKLGEGGMATVWKIEDSRLLRSVALKQLRQDKTASHHEHENFIVEAQVTAQLQHPGIVPIHDLQIDDNGGVYFTMREIRGQTLEVIIQSVHKVSNKRWEDTADGWNLRRLIEVLVDLCQTLSYAHMRGVIHQDIKPDNIMIGDYGEVLIVDWGIARVRSLYADNPNWIRIKASEEFLEFKRTAILVLVRFMAPEQLGNQPELIDGRADVYALGSILFIY